MDINLKMFHGKDTLQYQSLAHPLAGQAFQGK